MATQLTTSSEQPIHSRHWKVYDVMGEDKEHKPVPLTFKHVFHYTIK